MTKEQKDKIFKALAEDRNNYARDCNRRIAEENGKIMGADYMIHRFFDIFNAEVDPQESEVADGMKEPDMNIPFLMHKEMDIPISDCQKAYEVAIDYLRSQGKLRG